MLIIDYDQGRSNKNMDLWMIVNEEAQNKLIVLFQIMKPKA